MISGFCVTFIGALIAACCNRRLDLCHSSSSSVPDIPQPRLGCCGITGFFLRKYKWCKVETGVEIKGKKVGSALKHLVKFTWKNVTGCH